MTIQLTKGNTVQQYSENYSCQSQHASLTEHYTIWVTLQAHLCSHMMRHLLTIDASSDLHDHLCSETPIDEIVIHFVG